jgi:hypothetical protein
MNMVTEKDLISQFISFYKTKDTGLYEILNDKDNQRIFLSLGFSNLASKIPHDDLESLIKGIVLFCKPLGFRRTGGSVSPVIYLYRIYASRFPDFEPSLTRWVVLNRINPYEPYGCISNNTAFSLAVKEMRDKEDHIKSVETLIEHNKECEIQLLNRNIKSELIANRATRNLAAAVKRGDLAAVKAMLKNGADLQKTLPNGSSLVEVAIANGRIEVKEFLMASEFS